MISGVIFSFILTVICLLFAKPILMLLQVDASIFTMTTEYMRIIFFGLMFTFLYNFFSSTVEIAQPLHPAFNTITKNKSPNIFNTALIIKK